jgi:predicted nicotinamide N-methyase
MKKTLVRLALVAILAVAAAAPPVNATDWPIPACWPNCPTR